MKRPDDLCALSSRPGSAFEVSLWAAVDELPDAVELRAGWRLGAEFLPKPKFHSDRL